MWRSSQYLRMQLEEATSNLSAPLTYTWQSLLENLACWQCGWTKSSSLFIMFFWSHQKQSVILSDSCQMWDGRETSCTGIFWSPEFVMQDVWLCWVYFACNLGLCTSCLIFYVELAEGFVESRTVSNLRLLEPVECGQFNKAPDFLISQVSLKVRTTWCFVFWSY